MLVPIDVHIAGCGMWRPDPCDIVSISANTSNEGYESYCNAPPEISISDMSFAAAKQALRAANAEPDSIQQVFFAWQFIKDKSCWSAASDVARRLGIPNCPALDVFQSCNGVCAAIELSVSKMVLNRKLDNVLIVAADRYPAQLCKKDECDDGVVFSDGAGALILSRGPGEFAVRSFASAYDCGLNELSSMSFGSLKDVLSGFENKGWSPYDDKVVFREDVRARGLPDSTLVDAFTSGASIVCKEICEDVGVTSLNAGFDKVIMTNYGLRLATAYADRVLHVPLSKTTYSTGVRWGHMGNADLLVNWTLFLEREDCVRNVGACPNQRFLWFSQGMGINSWGVVIERK
eukprot:ANDGO_01432.mRNA.1 3-oxoacyl-[acyl-carrier-protein] synthase 3 protein 3